MQLLINSNKDTFETHRDNDLVVGYIFYKINGDVIGFYGKDSNVYPKSNYEFVVSINGKSIVLNSLDNLYQLDNGEYFMGRVIK